MAPLKNPSFNVLLALSKNKDFNLSPKKSREVKFIEFWEEVKEPIAEYQDSFLKKRKIGGFRNYKSDKELLEKVFKDLMSYHTSIKMETRGEYKKICKQKKIPSNLKIIKRNFANAIKRFGRVTSERNYEPWEICDLLETIVMDIDDIITEIGKLDKINNPPK